MMERTDPIRELLRTFQTSCCRIDRTIAVAVLLNIPCPPVVLSADPTIETVAGRKGRTAVKRPNAESPVAADEGTLTQGRKGSLKDVKRSSGRAFAQKRQARGESLGSIMERSS